MLLLRKDIHGHGEHPGYSSKFFEGAVSLPTFDLAQIRLANARCFAQRVLSEIAIFAPGAYWVRAGQLSIKHKDWQCKPSSAAFA